jgi:hypothetical protein
MGVTVAISTERDQDCFRETEELVRWAAVRFLRTWAVGVVGPIESGIAISAGKPLPAGMLRESARAPPAPLKRKRIAESNRNRRELSEHRAHESDMECAGCLRGLWLNRKAGTAVPAGADVPLGMGCICSIRWCSTA